MKPVNNQELKAIYERNMKYDSLQNQNIRDTLKVCGELVDTSHYLRKVSGIKRAITLLKELEDRNPSSKQKGCLFFYLGNAFSDLEDLRTKQSNPVEWDNKNKETAILYFRKALAEKLNSKTKAEVLINLGNLYDIFGRFVKSIELYDQALKEKPKNQMGHGNKGISLFYYGLNLYDGAHKIYFLFFADQHLKNAISLRKHQTEESIAFEKYHNQIKTLTRGLIGKVDISELDKFSLGRSKEERKYKGWCLDNRLFLNPLNDLGEYTIAAQDVLHLPSMILDIDQNHIEFPSFFNQLKQEYVSARYLSYEGMNPTGVQHFSDTGVLLINPLDYPQYSLNIEKIKGSFRTLYSLFDKISFFINHYLNLKFEGEHRLNFRTVWYNQKDKKGKKRRSHGKKTQTQKLNSVLTSMNNLAFRGLFLISKDLLFHHPNRTEDDRTIKQLSKSLEPSAKEINELRNKLEHGYVKVHEDFYDFKTPNVFKDKLSHSISESDLKNYTLKLLKLCREALIYLSLGVHIEERKKSGGLTNKEIPTIDSDVYEDNWKL